MILHVSADESDPRDGNDKSDPRDGDSKPDPHSNVLNAVWIGLIINIAWILFIGVKVRSIESWATTFLWH